MSVHDKCSVCDSTHLESGSMQSTGRIYFRLKHGKFLTLGTGDIPVTAKLCRDCGHIMLWGDLKKADKLLDKTQKD